MKWSNDKLGNLTEIVSGTTPNSEIAAYWNGKHVWITPTDLGKLDNAHITSSERKITDEGLTSCNLTLVPKNSVVMSSRAPIGHLGIAATELYTNQGCKSFKCGFQIDPLFLYFNLKYRMREIQILGSGSTFAEVSKSQLGEFEIHFPSSIAEQQKIAFHLQSQFGEIEKARKAAEIQKQEIKQLKNLIRKNSFETILNKWSRSHLLKDVAAISAGGTPSRGNSSFFIGEIPWAKTLDLNFGLVLETQEKITQDAFKSIRGEMLPIGTVLVAMYGGAGTIGKSGILGIESCTNQAICALQPNLSVLTSEFLHEWLCYIRPEWMRHSSGNRKDPNINKAVVENMTIPLLPLKEQHFVTNAIKEALTRAETAENAIMQQYEEIIALPKKILDKAFNEI